MQGTALVHEAYLRLVSGNNQEWKNSRYFFTAAAEAMQRILIEKARKKARLKHGGDQKRIELDNVPIVANDDNDTVLAVNEAVENLARRHPIEAEVVKLRYFIGLQNQEVADILEISEPTVRRYWNFARSWLYVEIKRNM